MTSVLAALTDLLASPGLLGHLLIGTVAGLLAGLMPGVSGRSALLIALPFVLGMEPLDAAVLLIAMHAVSHSTGPIAAILFGAPTSSAEAATAIDGFPMARRKEAQRAIGAVLASSMLGGLIGAVVLFAFAPAASRLALVIGTPETAVLAVVGLLAIAAVSSSGLMVGIVVGSLGVLASTIGMDVMTGFSRYSFGILELSDGISPAAVIAGIIAVPELLARVAEDRREDPERYGWHKVLKGCIEPIRHGWLVLRCAGIGVVTGLIPGIGTSVAVWVAYGHAAQSRPSGSAFGEGAIEGVIAPEAANGGKEGGAFIPTLFFGIPGSSAMAIMLGAFAMIGIEVGPRMVLRHPQFPATVAWTLVLSNVIAFCLCMAVAPWLARLAAIRRSYVVPLALAASVLAAYAAAPGPATLVQIIVFSLLGILLMVAGAARPPFLLGFVIGPILESAILRAATIHGWSAFSRPAVLIVVTAAALIIALSLRRRATGIPGGQPAVLLYGAVQPVMAGAIALFALAGFTAYGFPGSATLLPSGVCLIGMTAALLVLLSNRRGVLLKGTALHDRLDGHLIAGLTAALLIAFWTGPAISLGMFVLVTLVLARRQAMTGTPPQERLQTP